MGVAATDGRAVSTMHGIHFEFGSGVVPPQSGFWWRSQGCAFDLRRNQRRSLEPGRESFHTLNAAVAQMDDGRLLVCATMGGEGQPQTPAPVFARRVGSGPHVCSAIAAPGWLLGRSDAP